MQVIENLTRLNGVLRAKQDDPSRPGWLQITLAVQRLSPVGELPSLIDTAPGETLEVLVAPAERPQLEALAEGAELELQVRLKGPGVRMAVLSRG